jgi:hypothetical protein
MATLKAAKPGSSNNINNKDTSIGERPNNVAAAEIRSAFLRKVKL